ncbi:MAG: capsule assembly Wzi family protein [Bacteroidota bacterium]
MGAGHVGTKREQTATGKPRNTGPQDARAHLRRLRRIIAAAGPFVVAAYVAAAALHVPGEVASAATTVAAPLDDATATANATATAPTSTTTTTTTTTAATTTDPDSDSDSDTGAGAGVDASAAEEAATVTSLPTTFTSVQEPLLDLEMGLESATGRLDLSIEEASVTIPRVLGTWLSDSSITVGRHVHKWGPGLSGSLLLSGSAPLDGITVSAGTGSFRYVQVAAARDAARARWVLAHRIEGQVIPGVEVGVSEAVAVSGGFRLKPYYLIPGCPYHLSQYLSLLDDRSQDWWTNVLAAVDASVAISPRIRLYGEFLADDFPWAASARGRVPYMIGALAGFELDAPLALEPCRGAVEYVRINNYVYSHKNPENAFVGADGRLIGHPLGPDADAVYLFVTCPIELGKTGILRDIQATGRLGYERHGEGKVGHPWDPSEGVAHEFLSGTVETRTSLALGVKAGPGWKFPDLFGSPRSTLEFGVAIESVGNAGHVPSAQTLEVSMRVCLRLSLAP